MFAKIEKNEVIEYPIDDIRALFPDVSLPEDLTMDGALPDGFVYVSHAAEPYADEWKEKVVPADPVLSEGKWVKGYKVVPLTDDELSARLEAEAAKARSRRDRLLAECDWTQAKDVPDEVSEVWAEYRRQLRDITKQDDFPRYVRWPAKPR